MDRPPIVDVERVREIHRKSRDRRAQERLSQESEVNQATQATPLPIPARKSSLLNLRRDGLRPKNSVRSRKSPEDFAATIGELTITMDGTLRWKNPDIDSARSLFRYTLNEAHHKKLIEDKDWDHEEYQKMLRLTQRELRNPEQLISKSRPSSRQSQQEEVAPEINETSSSPCQQRRIDDDEDPFLGFSFVDESTSQSSSAEHTALRNPLHSERQQRQLPVDFTSKEDGRTYLGQDAEHVDRKQHSGSSLRFDNDQNTARTFVRSSPKGSGLSRNIVISPQTAPGQTKSSRAKYSPQRQETSILGDSTYDTGLSYVELYEVGKQSEGDLTAGSHAKEVVPTSSRPHIKARPVSTGPSFEYDTDGTSEIPVRALSSAAEPRERTAQALERFETRARRTATIRGKDKTNHDCAAGVHEEESQCSISCNDHAYCSPATTNKYRLKPKGKGGIKGKLGDMLRREGS